MFRFRQLTSTQLNIPKEIFFSYNMLNFPSAGLKLDEVGLVLDISTDHTLEAFVRFETSDDFDLALKRNWEIMGNR